ncbi:MAG: hypothetical protein JO222_15425 [Frankiales bacterium]|nr:hypothetical protein [Frankiales bacterium]
MRPEPTCPRCGGELRAPGLWSSAWQCASHGSVPPYTVLTRPGVDAVEHVVKHASVPAWLPHGLSGGWLCTGFGVAGDDRDGARAVATSMSGPSPVGGPADLLLVAEEMGVGLGARYAGLPGPDPGAGFDAAPPDAKVSVAGHPTAMWSLPVDGDCAVFVGEAKGHWLWALVWPAGAGIVMYDEIALVDLRDGFVEAEMAFGSLSPRLVGEAPPS